MAQIASANCTVTNGSPMVSFPGVDLTAVVNLLNNNTSPAFNKTGQDAVYSIIACDNVGKTVTLSVPFAGVTETTQAQITISFSPISGLYEPDVNDVDIAILLKHKLVRNVDKFGQLASGISSGLMTKDDFIKLEGYDPKTLQLSYSKPTTAIDGDLRCLDVQFIEFAGNPILRPSKTGNTSEQDQAGLRDMDIFITSDGMYNIAYVGQKDGLLGWQAKYPAPDNPGLVMLAQAPTYEGPWVRKGLINLSTTNYATYYSRYSNNDPCMRHDGVNTWYFFGTAWPLNSVNGQRCIGVFTAPGAATSFPMTGWVAQPPILPAASGWTADFTTSPTAVRSPQIHAKDGGGWIMYATNWNIARRVGYLTAPSLAGPWTIGEALIGDADYHPEQCAYFKYNGKHFLIINRLYPGTPGLDLWVSDAQTGPFTLALSDIISPNEKWKSSHIGTVAFATDDLSTNGVLEGVVDADNSSSGNDDGHSIGLLKIVAKTFFTKFNGSAWVNENKSTTFGATLPKGLVSINDDRIGFGTELPSAQFEVSKEFSSPNPSNVMEMFTAYGDQARKIYRRANGTKSNPSPVPANGSLFSLSARGYKTTGFSSTGVASINFVTEDVFTDSSTPTKMVFYTTPTGTTIAEEALIIHGNKTLEAKGTLIAPTLTDGVTTKSVTELWTNSGGRKYNKVNMDYSPTTTDDIIEVIGGAGNVIVPSPEGFNGKLFTIINNHPGGTIVTTGGYSASIANGSRIHIASDGAAWNSVVMDVASTAAAAGASGQLQFNNGSNALAADSNLYWDNSNKRLGIGTTNPSTSLHIKNDSLAPIILERNSVAAGTVCLSLFNPNTTVGAGIAANFQGFDTNGNMTVFSQIRALMVDKTDTSEDGDLVFLTLRNGTLTEGFRVKSTGILNALNTPSYADNATAKAAGLVDGDIYRNGDMLMIVHS